MSSTIGLYEFLSESELQHYYNALKSHLKVNTVQQLKFVEEEDLASIGMTKPESRRLKKFFNKYYPQTYFGKFMKILYQKAGAESRRASMVYPDVSQDKHTVKVPSKHIIPADAISVCKELGTGEFGVVQQGVWTNEDGERIQVAIKCLSKDRMQNNPMDFLKEASIMHTIDHEHIVRLYGVVLSTNTLMLVTELAPLRSLLECIKEPTLRPNFPVLTLCDFAIQICDGMQYLESKRLIHRDLAARNILVFSKNKVKISDFGLSRALGVGKDYYQTNFNVNLKLPIAWCAPECINYLRFTSASDIWAFGVTLWEMFSYGFQPWAALTGQQILEAIDQPNNQRLEQPECCPKDYYNIMLKSWEHDSKRRPHFSELFTMLPECRPEQVQAVSDFLDPARKDQLLYKVGDIITVLDKNPLMPSADDTIPIESSNLWKGILNSGKTGLFSPNNTVAYLGTNIPTMKPTNFSRAESKSSVYASKRRLRPDMISGPQGDLKHTGHVGLDGAFFGDISFLADKYQQLPKQIVAPYKPQEDDLRSDRTPLIGSPKLDLKDLTNGSDTVSRLSWVSEAPSMSTLVIKKGYESQMGSNLTLRSSVAAGGIGDNYSGSSLKSCAVANLILKPEDHEYHQISDDDSEGVIDSPMLEKSLDFGPSLMDEIFKALDAKTEQDETSNLKNEFKELVTSKAEKNKKKASNVKRISPAEERELESAIAMANEIANKTMDEMDRKMDSELGQTQDSPNQQKKRFILKLGKSSSPKAERAAFTDKTLSKPDLEGSLTPEAKEAYNVLVDQGQMDVIFEPQEAEPSNPLRMLRSGIPVMPKVRGNKHSLCRTNSQDGSNTLPHRTTVSPRITNPQSRSMENMKGSSPNQTCRLYSNQNNQVDSKLTLLERTVSSSQLPAVPEKNQGQEGDISVNPLPLPPRDRTKPIPAPKPRQRKHPLIVPGNTRPLVKPALSMPEMPSGAPPQPRDRIASEGGISFEDSEMSDSSSTMTESGLTSYSSSDLQLPRKHKYNAYELGVYDMHDQFWSKSTTLDPQVQADIDSLDDMPEEEAPPLPLSNHRVSCEDLLEFAMDRPNTKRTQGRDHGPDSDEVHIMKKVLTQEVSIDDCLHALNETDWDVHKAIKYVKLQYLLNTQLGTIERCKQTLIHCNWEVQKAANYMLANPSEESETIIL